MQLSTKARYVIRALMDIAVNYDQSPVLVKDIAGRQGISPRYLEQLLLSPKAAGMVRSARGSHGGFSLAKPPSAITLKDIVQITEGSVYPTECADDPESCQQYEHCVTHEVWVRIKNAAEEILGSTTLQDLVDRQIAKKKETRYPQASETGGKNG